ncbi:MAG TPA: glutaredoxin family protein [Spirochaetia bacterium]|jgi:glutaredoxin|nr:glutaredoxin family protein [Spirochaetia bacterium]
MYSDVIYTEVKGEVAEHDITVYALSTCGFCKRALAFLNDNGVSYRYVYFDKLSEDEKASLRKRLMNDYKEYLSFPYAIIDDKDVLVGFIEANWRAALGL